MGINKAVLNQARVQVGGYLQIILDKRGWSRTKLANEAGITREQVQWILEGKRSYTIDTFMKVIKALDCYFYLADRDGKHLDQDDMVYKSNVERSMDHR